MMYCGTSLADVAHIRQPIHWAVGFFDGLHRGHQRVIGSAASPGALRGVLSFHPHPLALLRPEAAPQLLTPTAEHKRRLMETLGVDVLLTLPFTQELAAMPAEHFMRTLVASCPAGVAGISVGANWRFGHGGGGTVALLHTLAAGLGFRVCENALLSLPTGETVCSSAVRHALAAGDLPTVQAMLGRPFDMAGTVESGQKLARTLGFPTANIALPADAALPPFGAYEVQAELDGRILHGVANLGLRPTIQEDVKQVRLETHFLDFSGDLYGRFLSLSLLRFLRPERRFPSLAALRGQVEQDIATVRLIKPGAFCACL